MSFGLSVFVCVYFISFHCEIAPNNQKLHKHNDNNSCAVLHPHASNWIQQMPISRWNAFPLPCFMCAIFFIPTRLQFAISHAPFHRHMYTFQSCQNIQRVFTFYILNWNEHTQTEIPTVTQRYHFRYAHTHTWQMNLVGGCIRVYLCLYAIINPYLFIASQSSIKHSKTKTSTSTSNKR